MRGFENAGVGLAGWRQHIETHTRTHKRPEKKAGRARLPTHINSGTGTVNKVLGPVYV